MILGLMLALLQVVSGDYRASSTISTTHTSDVLNVDGMGLVNHEVQFSGTANGETMIVSGSTNGQTFVNIGSATSSANSVSFAGSYRAITISFTGMQPSSSRFVWTYHGYALPYLNGGSSSSSSTFNTCDASTQIGVDMAAKISTCITSLTVGGTINAGALTGAQAWATCPFDTSSTRQITLVLGASSVTQSANCTMTSNYALTLLQGSIISPVTGVTLTLTGPVNATLSNHFSGAGKVYVGPKTPSIYPEWFGALGDGSTDDTTGIQNAIYAAQTTDNGVAVGGTSEVVLTGNFYKTTNQLVIYGRVPHEIEGSVFRGVTTNADIIYYGPSNKSAIRLIGSFGTIRDLAIENRNGVGWVAGISYDGDATIGRSTSGFIHNVHIDCNGGTGDAIATGLSSYQADMLEINHSYLSNCTSGSGIATYDANSLSINVIAPTIGGNHIGIHVGTTTNLNVFGGEIDNNDINFVPNGGGAKKFDGVRSEGSKRTLWTSVGTYPDNVTLSAYTLSSHNIDRPATTATVSASSNDVVLSVAGYISGDFITIAGAGAAGATYHGQITAMASLTSMTIQPAASTTVTVGSVALDAVQQDDIYWAALGSYLNLFGSTFGPSENTTVSAGRPVVAIGNTWVENTLTPWGPVASPLGTSFGNTYNDGTLQMQNTVPSIQLYSTGLLSWNDGTGTADTFLGRNSANIIQQKNGNAAQALRIYGTSTKYLQLQHDGTNVSITADSGTNAIGISVSGNNPIFIGAGEHSLRSGEGNNATYLGLSDQAWKTIFTYNLQNTCVAFSALPTPATGMQACVTDSTTATWGATVTGMGSNNVQVRYNGTNWTVMGK